MLEDLFNENKAQEAKYEKKLAKLEKEKWSLAQENEKLREEKQKALEEKYEAEVKLYEADDVIKKLLIEKNKDYTNSSNASSKEEAKPKIQNSREKTGKKPGGQKGHEGHRRKQFKPTEIISLPEPKEYAENDDYQKTGKIIKKQRVNIEILVTIIEYQAAEYRHKKTRQRVHAEFPHGLVNEVTYSEAIKAFAFLLNNQCNVSIDKTRELLSQLTDGELELSKGFINGLTKEFAKKSEKEQNEIIQNIMSAPVQHGDFTGSRINGKNKQVFVCSNELSTMYFPRDHKGHKGIAGSSVEHYLGVLIHDHDKTFYSYGLFHQECLAHILRYLIGSAENESHLTWNGKMHKLLLEMIHYRKYLTVDDPVDEEQVEQFVLRYDAILKKAEKEYKDDPPRPSYVDGRNLARRMKTYKDSHLLFLYDHQVPYTNNLCERDARKYKRKPKQVMAFLSDQSWGYFCRCLSVLTTLNHQTENIYHTVSGIFTRKIAKPQRKKV